MKITLLHCVIHRDASVTMVKNLAKVDQTHDQNEGDVMLLKMGQII